MQRVHRNHGRIWVDVTEVFNQFRFARHPSGVSRVVVNFADALRAEPGQVFGSARLLIWDSIRGFPVTLDDPRLTSLALFLPKLMELYSAAGMHRTSHSSRAMKAFVTSIPRQWRYRIFPSDNAVTLFTRWAAQEGIQLEPVRFALGDCLFVPGSFWLGRYADRLAARANAAGVPVSAFIHDVLPLSHPGWFPRRESEQFRRACDTFLPACAAIICNSSHTRNELRRLLSLAIHSPIYKCRFGDRPFAAGSAPIPTPVSDMLARRYVLFVSTIIERKNHKLLVAAWRHLWRELGPATPYLVFVGGGAPGSPLSDMLASEKAEGNRIVLMTDVDDNSLEALYNGAWMTFYPSLAEGYGLPIAEALSRGKVCLAAPSGGVREIDEKLIDFIDPTDAQGVAKKVMAYLSDPARLKRREEQIRRNYRSTDWAETARAVRSVLEATMAGCEGMHCESRKKFASVESSNVVQGSS